MLKFLYLTGLFLFGVSLVWLPALSLFLLDRNDALIWGGIILVLGLVAAIGVDDGICKLLKIEWEVYIASVVLITFILIVGVSVQWR